MNIGDVISKTIINAKATVKEAIEIYETVETGSAEREVAYQVFKDGNKFIADMYSDLGYLNDEWVDDNV